MGRFGTLGGVALTLAVVVLCACGGGSGGATTDPGTDPGVADVPADGAVAADVVDESSVDVPVVGTDATVPDATVDDVPPEVAPDVPIGPICRDDVCAADKDHAPDPMAFGPFAVGLRRFEWVDEDDPYEDGSPRTLVTEIWYPTTEEYRDKPKFAYDLMTDGPAELKEKFAGVDVGTFPVDAVKDAPVRRDAGKFPLVLFSHGAYGIRYQSVFFTVQLASHGYVVVSPDHEKNTLYDIILKGYDGSTLGDSALRRPKDMAHLVKRMTALNEDATSDFHGVVSLDEIGMSGHSFGGYNCFATAVAEPRIKVIVPMAPAAYLAPLLGIFFPDWHMPTVMMGGEKDRTLDYQQSCKGPYDEMGGPKWLLDLKRGGHYTFSDICRLDLTELVKQYPDADDALTDGCGAENWAYADAQKAINLYAIAAFNRYLRHSEGSADFLTPAAGAQFGDEILFDAVPNEL